MDPASLWLLQDLESGAMLPAFREAPQQLPKSGVVCRPPTCSKVTLGLYATTLEVSIVQCQ